MNIPTHVLQRSRGRFLALLALLLVATAAHGASPGHPEYRIGFAGDRFSGTTRLAASFYAFDWQRFHVDRFELTLGAFTTDAETRPFIAFGPVWRRSFSSSPMFVEFGISPTVLGGSTFDGEELGGNFHFSSRLVVGMRLGEYRQHRIALEALHLSNGRLRDTNPGMDMLGVSFGLGFGAR